MYDPNENQNVFGDGSGVGQSDVLTQLAPSMRTAGGITMPQIPSQVMDLFEPSQRQLDRRSLSSGYGTPGSGARATDYALSLGQGPRQRVREFDQQQTADIRWQQSERAADNERRRSLATAVLEHIFAPSIQAQSNIGAQQVAAQGRRDVAEIEGQTQRDVATINRPSMFEQFLKAAPVIGEIIARNHQMQQGQIIPPDGLLRMPDGQTISNPRPKTEAGTILGFDPNGNAMVADGKGGFKFSKPNDGTVDTTEGGQQAAYQAAVAALEKKKGSRLTDEELARIRARFGM